MHDFAKIVLIAKKGSVKVTSTTFLLRKAEQLVFYQLLPDLTVWEDLG